MKLKYIQVFLTIILFTLIVFYLVFSIFVFSLSNNQQRAIDYRQFSYSVDQNKQHTGKITIAHSDPFPLGPSDIQSVSFRSPTPKVEQWLSKNQRKTLNKVLTHLNVTRKTKDVGERGDIRSLCVEVGNTLGSVTIDECMRQKLRSSDDYSTFNRALVYKNYLPKRNKKALSKILVIGGIHGDEYSATSIIFKWMSILNRNHSGKFHWKFIPLANPDGLIKNGGTRYNGNGVDINRNFPTSNWDTQAEKYWTSRVYNDKRYFPGRAANSEPETQWLVKQINEFNPNVIISVHAPYGMIDIDGRIVAPSKLGPLKLKELGVYPGSLGNYGSFSLNTPVLTIELKSATRLPSAKEIRTMWVDIVRWLIQVSQ